MALVQQLLRYFRIYKKYWLAPIIFILLGVGGIVVVVQGSAVAPFIYALF